MLDVTIVKIKTFYIFRFWKNKIKNGFASAIKSLINEIVPLSFKNIFYKIFKINRN